MPEHPIQGLMKTAMDSIKEMVDVNTVIGDPVETQDGSVIVPISRVTFGFAAGGGEYKGDKTPDGLLGMQQQGGQQGGNESQSLPFAGGSGAGVSVQPVGFLIVGQGSVRMLPVEGGGAMIDRLIDMTPQVLSQVGSMIKGGDRIKTEGYKV